MVQISPVTLDRLGHLNLIEFARNQARWSGLAGAIEEREGVMLWATGTSFPFLCNGVFRIDGSLPPSRVLDLADTWFARYKRGYTVQVRDTDEDADGATPIP